MPFSIIFPGALSAVGRAVGVIRVQKAHASGFYVHVRWKPVGLQWRPDALGGVECCNWWVLWRLAQHHSPPDTRCVYHPQHTLRSEGLGSHAQMDLSCFTYVSMCIYTYIYPYIFVYMCMYIYPNIFVNMCIHICVHVFTRRWWLLLSLLN